MDPTVSQHILDEEHPGGVVINPHSPLGKEIRKWEQHYSELTPRGTHPGNPYVYREFPKMLYRAQTHPNGQTMCMAPQPSPYEFSHPDLFNHACLMTDSFNRQCYKIVGDESEERLAKGQGWCNSIKEAMELAEHEAQAIGNAAAEAAYSVRTMGSLAQKEYAEAEQMTHEHVTDVVGSSQKTVGRVEKIKPVTKA